MNSQLQGHRTGSTGRDHGDEATGGAVRPRPQDVHCCGHPGRLAGKGYRPGSGTSRPQPNSSVVGMIPRNGHELLSALLPSNSPRHHRRVRASRAGSRHRM